LYTPAQDEGRELRASVLSCGGWSPGSIEDMTAFGRGNVGRQRRPPDIGRLWLAPRHQFPLRWRCDIRRPKFVYRACRSLGIDATKLSGAVHSAGATTRRRGVPARVRQRRACLLEAMPDLPGSWIRGDVAVAEAFAENT